MYILITNNKGTSISSSSGVSRVIDDIPAPSLPLIHFFLLPQQLILYLLNLLLLLLKLYILPLQVLSLNLDVAYIDYLYGLKRVLLELVGDQVPLHL